MWEEQREVCCLRTEVSAEIIGLRAIDEAAERLDERLERCQRLLVTATEQDGDAVIAGGDRVLDRQRRLADARFARQQEHFEAALPRLEPGRRRSGTTQWRGPRNVCSFRLAMAGGNDGEESARPGADAAGVGPDDVGSKASRAGSCWRICCSRRANAGLGSIPSSSPSRRRSAPNDRKASACRPDRYSASMRCPQKRSRNGWAAHSASRSPTSPVWRPHAKLGVDAFLDHLQTQRLQSHRRRDRPGRVGELTQCRPPPPPHGFRVGERGAHVIVGLGERPTASGQLFDERHVGRVGGGVQSPPTWVGAQPQPFPSWVDAGQPLLQPRQVGLERAGSGAGRIFGPERVDE